MFTDNSKRYCNNKIIVIAEESQKIFKMMSHENFLSLSIYVGWVGIE